MPRIPRHCQKQKGMVIIMAGFSRFGAVAKRLEEKFIKGNPITERNAFSSSDAVEFRIRVPESTVRATMEIFSDATGKRRRFSMKKNKGRYSLTLDMSKLCGAGKTGLFYYKYRVQTEMGAFDMVKKECGRSSGEGKRCGVQGYQKIPRIFAGEGA